VHAGETRQDAELVDDDATPTTVVDPTAARIRRKTVLNGLNNEYSQAASPNGNSERYTNWRLACPGRMVSGVGQARAT
jgi:hypothetical protein